MANKKKNKKNIKQKRLDVEYDFRKLLGFSTTVLT